MYHLREVIVCFMLLSLFGCQSTGPRGLATADSTITIMAYNLHNIFDAEDDEGKNDFSFLPANHPNLVKHCNLKKEEARKSLTKNNPILLLKSKLKYLKKDELDIANEITMDNKADNKKEKRFLADFVEEQVHRKLGKDCNPNRQNNWTKEKFAIKLTQVKKVFDEFTKQKGKKPDLVNFVEVENEFVIRELANTLGYTKYYITNGPDKRGIDIAVLYNENNNLKCDKNFFVEHLLVGENFEQHPTRPILAMKCSVYGQTTNLFFNHWPSQGGPTEARVETANKLKELMLKSKDPSIATGDFNTTKFEDPRVGNPIDDHLLEKDQIFDVSYLAQERFPNKVSNMPRGTYFWSGGSNYEKFFPKIENWCESGWNMLDRFIINKALINGDHINIKLDSYEIYSPRFLTKNYIYEGKYSDEVCPKGTVISGTPIKYSHSASIGESPGYSDHFPIVVDIVPVN